MLKKAVLVIITIMLVIGMCGNVNAQELKTKLDIIQQVSEIKYLENEQGNISKTIVDSDVDTGEVTVDLSLRNITSVTEETERFENTEILIIVSQNIVNDTDKLNTYISYINTLATKIFEKNSNTKIGIIGMKGTVKDSYLDENGKMIIGDNDERTVKGTADNAETVVNLTKNTEDIKTGLQNMNSNKVKYRVNLQAAIKLANNSFSKDVNKLLISLYDGVPAIAIGVESSYSYGGWFSAYSTLEEALVAQHTHVSARTKSEILNLKNNNVEFILLRPEDTSYDEKWYSADTGEFLMDFDGSPYVKEIYGTLENPTYGKMYSLTNDNLETIVTEYIYNDIMEDIRVDIASAVIKEYFLEEILENFDIIFDNEDIDTSNLQDDRYITWKVGDVPGNSTASLKYTLKIKDMKNEELLDKIIATSEKTELTYINNVDEETTVESTSSPKIKLSKVIEELIATVTYDPTIETTDNVTVTIKTNKKVNPVEGWTLAEDGMTLTKIYSENVSETVHLVDEDNMTKDVLIEINNIIDNTVVTNPLPETGENVAIMFVLAIIIISSFIVWKKHRDYKEIK